MKAYLLLKLNPGVDLEQAAHALQEPGIERLDLVVGIYDAIATIQANDLAALGKLALRVRGCPAIRDSVTCPVVS